MPRNNPLTSALHRSPLKAVLVPSELPLSHLWPCAPHHLHLHCAPSGHKALSSLYTIQSPWLKASCTPVKLLPLSGKYQGRQILKDMKCHAELLE